MRYDEDMPSGICEECGGECTAVEKDFGIGPYEFWGDRGVHVDMRLVSPCCEANVVEGGNKVVRTAVHTARRDHKDGKIKKGEKYKIIVIRRWRKDGPSWITTSKRKIPVENPWGCISIGSPSYPA